MLTSPYFYIKEKCVTCMIYQNKVLKFGNFDFLVDETQTTEICYYQTKISNPDRCTHVWVGTGPRNIGYWNKLHCKHLSKVPG